MGIFGSISRYLRTYGRLMYVNPRGLASPMALRRQKKSPRARYLEMLEPRVLMTTVYGGDVFQYTDALGNPVTCTLNGNVIAELVSAVQAGGTSGKNQPAVGGYLIFGDIAGTFTSGPRKGVIIGNGSVPVNNGTQGSPTVGNAHIVIPGATYPDPNANPNPLTGNQVNLQTLSTNLAGQSFTFNLFDVNPDGTPRISPQDVSSKQQDWTMQLIQVDNATMAGKVIYSVDSDQPGSLLPLWPGDTTNTYSYANVSITAAAFNPLDNKLYFELSDTFTALAGTVSTVTYVDEIYSINPALGSTNSFTDVGAINVTRNNKQQPRQAVTGMAFTLNAADPTTATLYVSEQPTAFGGPPNLKPAPAPQLLSFDVTLAGTGAGFDPTSPVSTINLNEGYGGGRSTLTNIEGLSVLPGSQDGGGDGFLFALVGTGGNTHITRIDLATGNATSWGNTTDAYETNKKNPTAPYDGQSLTGFSYNPTLVNPFTGQLGAFMSIDTATTNLDFINHKLRINAGDVYSVYTTVSDINSSIAFQGANLYQGASGALGKNASPGNTGTVFIGYKGQIPDNSTNETFAASTPFLTGEITGSLGVMPGLIQDTTDMSVPSTATDKLFAGLDVAKSLQQAFNATGSIMTQTLGDAFNNVSGLAIAPDGTIAVMNSYFYNGAAGDQLAFVNPATGMINTGLVGTTGTTILNITLQNGTTSTALKNVEGLAYGTPNLTTGVTQLFAIYDLGDGKGPTLGTIGTSGIFTPIHALGLGAHGQVSAMMFTPGGTPADTKHESLYVVADPDNWDFDGTQYLYKINLTFSGANITNAVAANAPTYDTSLTKNVISSGGIGPVEDQFGAPLKVVSAAFDSNGMPLVLDRTSGRLMNLDLTTAIAGATFASGVGEINPTVAGIALDPVTLKFFVVDNLTGVQTVISNTGTDSSTVTASAILMQLKPFNQANTDAVSLGKFLVDGTVSGKVTVSGSMDLFYAGWLMTGDATNGGNWIIPTTAAWGSGLGTDSSLYENYFKDNFYIGGDLRNLACLTNIGTTATTSGVEITVLGKVGAVTALGSVSGVVHAENQDYIPNLSDATSVAYSISSYDSFGNTFQGSATATSSYLNLTSGLANQAGSVFNNTLQNVDNFTASFTFTATNATTGIDGGMAFVLQNQGLPALGNGGAQLGYGGILHSAALEFNFNPNAANTLGFQTNGAVGYTVNPGFSLTSGDIISAAMSYNGTTLLVRISDLTLALNFTTSFAVNLPLILGAHGAYVGFTGSSATVGNTTSIQSFYYGGNTPGQMQLPQEELQHYQVDITDYPSFGAGYLVDTANAAPFDNSSFATAQFLGTVDNAVPGQPNVIDLQGTLEGGPQPKKGGFGRENTVDYFAFGMLAGQTVSVSVTPRIPSTLLAGSAAGLVHFAIFDPDGNLVQSDYNWLNSSLTEDRTITFTADRPGAYRIAITNASNSNFTGGGTPGNTAYNLKITGAGVGNMGVGAVVAGGNLNLRGSDWVASSTASIDTITNPSIWTDTGDVGAVQAGGNITAQLGEAGLIQTTPSQGYSYAGSSSSDIYVPFGDLRSVVGGNMGVLVTVSGTQVLEQVPDINVSGNVGLLATTGNTLLSATFSRAPKNIQIISSAGDLAGVFRSNGGIGVIRAATVSNKWYDYMYGEWTTTEFYVDADRTGGDGIIDLIDVTGDWGAAAAVGHYAGAALVTGPGGNIRFMRVGGFLSQDSLFNSGDTGTTGEIVHTAGPVSYPDDSGALITFTPGSTTVVDATGGTLTTYGVLTTRVYGVRGAGGVVVVSVTSTNGLTISATGTAGSAEVGSIVVAGTGVPVTVVNGVPTVVTANTTGTATPANALTNVLLTSPNANMRVDVFDITGATIDYLSNTTPGEIYNVTATDIGAISSNGNVGVLPISKTGTAIIPLTTFAAGTFPFVAQYIGISAGNIGVIGAKKAIGNVLASGVIGTLAPNSDNVDDPGVFEGLVGPVVINGTATATFNSNTTVAVGATSNIVTLNVSITKANIGDGIPTQGNLPDGFKSGIYAAGEILNVSGTNADIRGNIMSLAHIGTITLTNGSIINTHVAVYTQFQMAQTFNTTAITLPNSSTLDTPAYLIDSINLQGNGGIIASDIGASSINSVVVAPSGFGIINSDIFGVSVGTLNTISAGGYGFRSDYINFARVNAITATGSGAVTPTSAYNARVRPSETYLIDPNTNTQPNSLTDLDVWMNGDPYSSLLLTSGADPAGLVTGQISAMTVSGQDRLGNVTAYDIRDSSFNFPISTGIIKVTHDIVDVEIITGSVTSVTIGNDATDFDLTAAGTIGPVFIGGDFSSSLAGTSLAVTTVSNVAEIVAKGAVGNIASFVNKGSFGGLLFAEGSVGSITIGTAGSKTLPATGDLSGTITVNGSRLTTTPLKSVQIFGSILPGGLIDLTGNIASLNIGQDVAPAANNIIVRGNLTNLLVGSDPAKNGSNLAGSVTITGNLASAVITGAMAGMIIAQGNVGNFAVTADPATGGTNSTSIFSGELSAAGTVTSAIIGGAASGNIVAGILNSVSIGGNLAGQILGGKSIVSATVAGNILPGAAVTSSLGDIKTLTVKGNIDGMVTAPNGAITTLNFSGALDPSGVISANSLGTVTIPGALAGTLNANTSVTSIKAGSVAATANITAAALTSLTTTGDMYGMLNAGPAAALKITVGGNFGAQLNLASPLSLSVTGNMVPGASIVDSNALTSLAVKGSLAGHVIVDRIISTITAASMNNAVITAGQGLASLKITGAVNNSLIQAGLSRGVDNIFGTNDLNEQGRMGDLGALSVGSLNNSIIAAGGNINSFVSTANMSSSSVSAGLVVQGSAVAAILADNAPLNSLAKLNAARQNPTLLHGSLNSVSVGVVTTTSTSNTLINSAVTAGVSPGADGAFGTADDNVTSSLTGGNSSITTFKGKLDASSHLLANTPSKTAIPGLSLLTYSTGGGANSILSADPITGAPKAIVTAAAPYVYTTAAGSITIKVTGAGATVSIYDSTVSADRLDTLLISNTASTPVTVTVTNASTAQHFDLGRVIAADNTQVSSFTYNGDILGDAAGGPSLWIDSDMTAFSVRNLPNDGTWNGRIGGNVGNLTINQLGPGMFRVGGRITTLNVASSVGNPLLQQLGLVTPPTTITQIAYSPLSGSVFASDGLNLLGVNVVTGTINSTVPVHTLLTNNSVSVSGLAFNAAGQLFGVATLNNQNPVRQLGAITTTGDTLHALAVSAAGKIYAIDSQSGTDKLVTLDPVTGAEILAGADGIIRDPHANTFANNITALAFDQNGNLLALTNDRDGTGGVNSTANGYAIAKIFGYDGTGPLSLSSPLTAGANGDPILLNGAVTRPLTALAVNQAGTIYAVDNNAGVQRLDTLTIAATGSFLTAVGNIKLSGANTQLTGIGVDEAGNLIGMNLNGTGSELVGISLPNPALSVRLDVPGLISQSLAGFAVGKSGANYATYAYTSNATTGGLLFVNPGVVSTLGQIAPNGAFTEMLPLAGSLTGAPLAGNVTSVAIDPAGDIFAITDQGVLAKYSSADGSIIGGQPIGVVKDAFGAALHITRISFNAAGDLVGLNANGNNLVKIGQTTTVLAGQNVALAANITELGTANAADLTALSFAPGLGEVLSYSTASGRFVNLLGSTPASIGGIVANSFGTANLPAVFSGHLGATGGGGVVVQGVDSIKLNGTGAFTGNISAVNSIGTVAGTGVVLQGSIISHADVSSVALSGAVAPSGVLAVDGSLKAFSLTGDFAGQISAGAAASVALKGSLLADGLIAVQNDLTTLSISGQDAGIVSAGSNKSLTVSGALAAGASIKIAGAAGAITLSGGTQLGSLLLAGQAATSITVGGTLAGVVATRKSLTTATLANVSSGIFAVGGDLTTLNVSGNVSRSIIAAGTWIGPDGVYNTADDVIYGGSIATAKIAGTFTDSAITAGILPPIGTTAGANNVPANFNIFDYNPSALSTSDIDAAESGGIGLSYIQSITFSKPVVSSAPLQGNFSALVASNGITKVATPVNTTALRQIVRTDPPGAPAILTTINPVTGLPVPNATRFSTGEIRIYFSEPLDTATINDSTIQVATSGTNVPVTDLTFGYFRQTAEDGSVQSVLQIFSPSHFNNSTGVILTLQGGLNPPTITDITGPRSSLLDYNQDGVNELDPFGTTFAGASFVLGPPANDNQANAAILNGFPVATQGTNVNATAELGETTHGGNPASESVWWSWTSPINGAVTVSTDGSNFDTTLSVYDASSIALGLSGSVGESDNDAAGLTSSVSFNATLGTQYLIAVDGNSITTGTTSTGHIVLTIKPAPPDVNDNLVNATVISGLPVSISGDNITATAEVGEPTHDGNAASNSVWWAWTPAVNGTVSVNTYGSNFATELSTYTLAGTVPSFASLTSIGEGADNLTFYAQTGSTYYIAVDGQLGATGNINLNILSTDPPANDNAANATVLVGAPVAASGNNLFATTQTGEPNYEGIYGGNSVWYNWVAPTTGLVTLTTPGTTFTTIVSVYRGTPTTPLGSLTTVTGSFTSFVYTSLLGGGSYYYSIPFNVVAGTSYMISVSGYNGDPLYYVPTGYFNLNIT